MNDQNVNNKLRLHNPKSNNPSLYIPNWLSQIPASELNPICKMVYGRLAQWASVEGRAHRSANDISIEVGIPLRSVQESIKKLKDLKLIGSFLPVAGGHNHYEFYDHEWMHRPLNPKLCYSNTTSDEIIEAVPYAQSAEGYAQSAEGYAAGAIHKIRLNKINKKNTTTQELFKISENVIQDERQESSSISFESLLEDLVQKNIKKWKVREKDIPRLRKKIREMMENNIKNGRDLHATSAYLNKIISNSGIELDKAKPPVKDPVLQTLQDREKYQAERREYEAKKNIPKAEYSIAGLHSLLKNTGAKS